MARIAVIDLFFQWPPDGGARMDLYQIFRRLAREHEVHFFIPSWDWQIKRGSVTGLDSKLGVTLIPVSFLSFHRFRFPRILQGYIQDYDPSHIFIADSWLMKPYLVPRSGDIPYYYRFYAYELTCLKAYGVAFREGKRCDRTWIGQGYCSYLRCLHCALTWALLGRSKFFLHEFLSAAPFFPDYRRRAERTLAQAQGILVYNEFLAQRLRVLNEKVHLVPSGVESTLFKPDPETYRGLETPSFLAIGRMDDPLKGFSVVRKAAQILTDRGYTLQLFYTGGKDFPEPYLINIGWLKSEQLPAWYQRVHAVLIPSLWWEPFGITALEGMASGVPVIASRVGGLLQIIADQKDGLLVQPGNEIELADAMEWIITHPHEACDLGRRGREKVQSQYNWEVITHKVASVLDIPYSAHALDG